jgi:hypothetical protein
MAKIRRIAVQIAASRKSRGLLRKRLLDGDGKLSSMTIPDLSEILELGNMQTRRK